ncbi:MAG: hypothetical protein MPW13_14790 [Candidatus Manganitrophus sp.]|nr:hypothetical protein [Candidatus Manganitrophus sp.]
MSIVFRGSLKAVWFGPCRLQSVGVLFFCCCFFGSFLGVVGNTFEFSFFVSLLVGCCFFFLVLASTHRCEPNVFFHNESGFICFQPLWNRQFLLPQEGRIEKPPLIPQAAVGENRHDGMSRPQLARQPDGAGDVDPRRTPHAEQKKRSLRPQQIKNVGARRGLFVWGLGGVCGGVVCVLGFGGFFGVLLFF